MSVNYEFEKALQRQIEGDTQAATAGFLQILKKYPKHADTLHHLGLIELQRGKVEEAIRWIRKSIEANSRQSHVFSNLGYCLNIVGDYPGAAHACTSAIELDVKNDGAWTNLGNSQKHLKNFEDAKFSYKTALSIQPSNPQYTYNLANTLYDLEDFESARLYFKKTISLQPNFPEAHNNLSVCLIKLKDIQEAFRHTCLAIQLHSEYAEAWRNQGVALCSMRRCEEALIRYERAIEIKPSFAEAWCSLGDALTNLQRYEDALISYKRAIEIRPNYAEAWCGQAFTLNELGLLDEALRHYQQAFEIEPDLDFLFGTLIHAQMKICDWTALDSKLCDLRRRIELGQKAATPFSILGLFDSPALQHRAAEIYANARYSSSNPTCEIRRPRSQSKIHVGYFSMDFDFHPVTYLMADVFKSHNRSDFVIYAFSYGHHFRDMTRNFLKDSFDEFIDIHDLSDLKIIELTRSLDIHIAVDLGGYTKGARTQIFSDRVAPIQVGYLGYPGTLGASFMDYFIGDRVTVTESNYHYFSEKIIYMPHQFQSNPLERPVPVRRNRRADFSLPADAFVFCCFNTSWKITPSTFSCWMQILQGVPDAILWLYADNQWVKENLLARANDHGVSSDRLVFSTRIPPEDYLAQYLQADLFLDTLPYNGGTTVSDALWMGCPVLTLLGQSFAGRMAASLMTGVGLSRLIAHSAEEYIAIATRLAVDPEDLRELKRRLLHSKRASSLFDTLQFTRNLETSYKVIHARHLANLAPDHIDLSEEPRNH